MRIAIQPDSVKHHGKTESYSARWAQLLAARSIEVKWMDVYEGDILERLRDCDALMWRTIHNPNQKQIAQSLLYVIERYLGIPVFPDHSTYWHYDDKIKQYYIFQALNIKTPKTWIFWNREKAIAWANQARYPIILKLAPGASSNNVRLIKDAQEAASVIKRMFKEGIYPADIHCRKNMILQSHELFLKAFLSRLEKACRMVFLKEQPYISRGWQWRLEKNYVYFQEFVPDNSFDTRVVVVGERIFAFRRFNRPGDFRASGSGNFDLDPKPIDKRCLAIAYHVSCALGCQSMAYDFLIKDGQPVITEMSYTHGTYGQLNWSFDNAPGYWTPDLNWQERGMWPEEAHIEDLLTSIESHKHNKNYHYDHDTQHKKSIV